MKKKFLWGLLDKETDELLPHAYKNRERVREEQCLGERIIKLVPEYQVIPVAKKKPEEKIDFKKVAKIYENEYGQILVDDGIFIEERLFGEFKGKAIFLDNETYEWKLVTDSEGETCLLAIRKD